MKVRLKGALTIGANNYPEGSELELPDEQAEELIQLELAEAVEEEKPKKGGKK
ncbi:hypothetical protein H5T87_05530 [bacterium]|nr:hypothetical protein [bacterium]